MLRYLLSHAYFTRATYIYGCSSSTGFMFDKHL